LLVVLAGAFVELDVVGTPAALVVVAAWTVVASEVVATADWVEADGAELAGVELEPPAPPAAAEDELVLPADAPLEAEAERQDVLGPDWMGFPALDAV